MIFIHDRCQIEYDEGRYERVKILEISFMLKVLIIIILCAAGLIFCSQLVLVNES